MLSVSNGPKTADTSVTVRLFRKEPPHRCMAMVPSLRCMAMDLDKGSYIFFPIFYERNYHVP